MVNERFYPYEKLHARYQMDILALMCMCILSNETDQDSSRAV